MKVAAVPRATRTAPVGGIWVPPLAEAAVTVPEISAFGAAGGKVARVSSTEPGDAGVDAPYAGVNSETPFGVAGPLTSFSVRRPRSLPGGEHRHARDVQRSVRVEPDARAPGERRLVECSVPHQDPARRAADPEQVSVHACDGCRRRIALLDRGQPLGAWDRLVREHRLHRPEPAGPRHGEDVDHDGPAGGELEFALEGEPGEQLLRSSIGRTDQDQRK
jgi:hypothetical protein